MDVDRLLRDRRRRMVVGTWHARNIWRITAECIAMNRIVSSPSATPIIINRTHCHEPNRSIAIGHIHCHESNPSSSTTSSAACRDAIPRVSKPIPIAINRTHCHEPNHFIAIGHAHHHQPNPLP
jgi:hypothetical protein